MVYFYSKYNLLLLVLVFSSCFLMLIGNIQRKSILNASIKQTIQNKVILDLSKSKIFFRSLLIVMAIFFIVLALARPQWGIGNKTISRKGSDIIFMIDTSLSMRATDIIPSRFEKSKILINKLISHIEGDRIGILAFAGDAFLYCPLTLDYSSFQLFLNSLDVGFIPVEGTSVQTALEKVLASITDDSNNFTTVIMFTDGEDHAGGLNNTIKQYKKRGIRVSSIGTATIRGAPIPLNKSNSEFKKDVKGNLVITKLNDKLLNYISEQTGGDFLPLHIVQNDVDNITNLLQNIEKRKIEDQVISSKKDRFPIFLCAAILCLIAELCISDIKKSGAKR